VTSSRPPAASVGSGSHGSVRSGAGPRSAIAPRSRRAAGERAASCALRLAHRWRPPRGRARRTGRNRARIVELANADRSLRQIGRDSHRRGTRAAGSALAPQLAPADSPSRLAVKHHLEVALPRPGVSLSVLSSIPPFGGQFLTTIPPRAGPRFSPPFPPREMRFSASFPPA
jgi:hypothetical protein